jgi:hypothetical protein
MAKLPIELRSKNMNTEQLIGQRIRLMQELAVAKIQRPQPVRQIVRLSRDLAAAERLLTQHDCQARDGVAAKQPLAA